jgi:hypothetical protein
VNDTCVKTVHAGRVARGFTILVLTVSFVTKTSFILKTFLNHHFKFFGQNCMKTHYRTDLSFELRIIKVFKKKQIHLYEFYFLET